VRHIPFADGIPDEEITLRDYDDRPVIRKNLCTGLNWQCPERCDDLNLPCEADPLRGKAEEITCELPRWPPQPEER
jgi:hypothetical protein